MARRCFYSFHYENDSWRVSMIKKIGAIEGQPVLHSNAWEDVARRGDQAIRNWIDDNMRGRSCVIVLIGSETANRRWVDYEIKKGWKDGKGLVGIHIHGLLDSHRCQSIKGRNPFDDYTIEDLPMSNWARTYDPPFRDSKMVYNYIAENIEDWVETAIALRN